MESQKSFAAVPWLVRKVATPSQFAWSQLKPPHMSQKELVWVDKRWSMLVERDVNGVITVRRMVKHTHARKRWEGRGSCSQRYSWGFRGVRTVQGD